MMGPNQSGCTKAKAMKRSSTRRQGEVQRVPRRPLRPGRITAPALGEILRTGGTAEQIADALIRVAGRSDIAQTRLW